MESPFSDVLNTNHAPSDREIPVIKGLIEEKEVVINAIDKEIEEMEAALNVLKERRGIEIKYVDEHRALLSPVKWVPIDILRSIFLLCNLDVGDTERENVVPYAKRSTTMTGARPSIIISHVCQHWRQISLDSPLLWDKITLFLPTYPSQQTSSPKLIKKWDAKMAKLIEILGIWVARSFECPLSLTLSISTGKYTNVAPATANPQLMQERFGKLVDLLCSTSSRWKSIDFDMGINEHTSPFFQLLVRRPDQVPMLEKIRLAILFESSYPGQGLRVSPEMADRVRGLSQQMGLFKSQSLRSLGVTVFWDNILHLPVDWSTLTYLSFGGYVSVGGNPAAALFGPTRFTASSALELLKTCPRLVHSTFYLDENTYLDPFVTMYNISNPITLPFLQSLQLHFSSLPEGFSSALVLPSLNTLLLLSHKTIRRMAAGGVVDCIRRFGDTLTTVNLNYTTLAHPNFINCLEHLPNVVDLKIASIPYGPIFDLAHDPIDRQAQLTVDLLRKLTPNLNAESAGDCYCPRLESFSCRLSEVSGAEAFSDEDLVEFAVARRTSFDSTFAGGEVPISRLRSLRVRFCTAQNVDVEAELRGRGVDMEGFAIETAYVTAIPPDLTYHRATLHPFEKRSNEYWNF